MSHDDQKKALIREMAVRTNQPAQHFGLLKDDALAGAGAVLVYLRTAGIRADQELKAMSDDDQRNILIVEIGGQLLMGSELQGLSNMELVLLGLGKPLPGGLTPGSFIRGVLLAGKFRTQHGLNKMSADDQRNTLIVELAAHSKETNLQSHNDFDLAGIGAVMVFLRETGIRTIQQLKTMSSDDQRNILIVEIGAQTNLGSKLQGLRNMDLVLAGLGVDPVFAPLPPPLQPVPA
jgi:hypothetical protein